MVGAQGRFARSHLIDRLMLVRGPRGNQPFLTAREQPRSSQDVCLRRGRLFVVLQTAAVVNYEVDNLVIVHIRGPISVRDFLATTSRIYAAGHERCPLSFSRHYGLLLPKL